MFTCRNYATKRRRPLLHENDWKLGMYFWAKWCVPWAWVADKLNAIKCQKDADARDGYTLVFQLRNKHGLNNKRGN